MPDIDIETAHLASMFVEAILYGMYAICFVISIVLLRRRSSTDFICVYVISFVMFTLATIHIGVNIYRLMWGYRLSHSDRETARMFLKIRTPSFLIKNISYVLQTLAGDGFLLYRLYTTWNGSKYVCAPMFLCFLACIGIGAQAMNSQARALPTSSIFEPCMQTWLVAFFSLTLFTDMCCSALIAFRIWWIQQQMRSTGQSVHLVPAAVLIIESGVAYSFCMALLLGLYLAKLMSHKIVLDAITQLIGLVFTAIIIRVSLGASTTDCECRSSTQFRLDTILYTQDRNPSTSLHLSRTTHSLDISPVDTEREQSRSQQSCFDKQTAAP